jgi:broad specificity phosphatase PhoE
VQQHTEIRVLVISNGKPEKEAGQVVTNWDIGAQLSSAGEKTVKHLCIQIKESLSRCQVYGASPLIKAQQTLFAIMDEMGIKKGDRAKHIHLDTAFWSFSPEIWHLQCRPSKYSNRKVYGYRQNAVIREGNTVLNAIIRLQEIAKSSCAETAIAVSHLGPLDAAIMVAKRALGQKVNIGNVRQCEGAIFHFGAFNKIIRVEDFLRD